MPKPAMLSMGKSLAPSPTAIVCSRDVDFGFSRMFQVFADLRQIPIKIMVLRNLEEAKEWIKSPEEISVPQSTNFPFHEISKI